MRESPAPAPGLAGLRTFLESPHDSRDPGAALQWLAECGHADLPCPGSGRTLERWRAFAGVAECDLVVAKLFESHADALAILQELGRHDLCEPAQRWAVWCAEPPDRRLEVSRSGGDSDVRLHGTKAWCSGAAHITWALVSGWDEAGRPCLAAVRMAQPEIRVTREGWHAVGMAATASVDVVFQGARATLVGRPGAYVDRPGFHHGAAGVAACWYGAATAIVGHVHESVRGHSPDPHALAHLGAMDVRLAQAAGLLRTAAAAIDADPGDACEQAVRRARLAVEEAAEAILVRAPRALGAATLCKKAHLARLVADLPVFIRQSHAERDLAAHGQVVAGRQAEALWTL